MILRNKKQTLPDEDKDEWSVGEEKQIKNPLEVIC